MRVTALIGAGAAIDIGGPTTQQITEKVVNEIQGKYLKNKKQYTLKGIYKILNNFYRDRESNFEDIFHTLEMLSSYQTAWGDRTVSKFKPSICAFIKANRHFTKYAPYIHFAQMDLLNTVAEQVDSYNEKYKETKHGPNSWYFDFWNKSNIIWDVTTLNYDTTIEESFDEFIDGFCKEKGQNFSRFYPTKLKKAHNKHTLAHIHGCINYGYPWGIHNQYIYEDDFHDQYKLEDYNQARQHWFGKTHDVSQAAEANYNAPIITGLRKLEKISKYPYSHYLYNFQDSLLKNNCLLIVGYGFKDLYLNQLMERMNIIHGEKKRIAIISFFEEECYDPLIFDEIPLEEYHFMCKQFRMSRLGKKGQCGKEGVLKSDDGTAILYLSGFKSTVLNHKDEIINFFNS